MRYVVTRHAVDQFRLRVACDPDYSRGAARRAIKSAMRRPARRVLDDERGDRFALRVRVGGGVRRCVAIVRGDRVVTVVNSDGLPPVRAGAPDFHRPDDPAADLDS